MGTENLRFDVSFCGDSTRQGENIEVLRAARSLFCLVRDVMREEENGENVQHTFSLLFFGMWYGTGRENLRFFEPHTLSLILWEMEHEGKRC